MDKIIFKTVDDYLAAVPGVQRKTLQTLRKHIREAAPGAEELISYGIPLYKQNGHVAAFGAFKKHCSFFPTSYSVIKKFEKELKRYKVVNSTIQFPVDEPLPAALVKKIVREKLKEIEAKQDFEKLAANKGKSSKLDDKAIVSAYMKRLKHDLKKEVETLRVIIKNADSSISERIKWSAPSYHVKGIDIATFNLRAAKDVHLVFHHPAIVRIKSALLQGAYKDRRIVYFENMQQVEDAKKELQQIFKKLLQII